MRHFEGGRLHMCRTSVQNLRRRKSATRQRQGMLPAQPHNIPLVRSWPCDDLSTLGRDRKQSACSRITSKGFGSWTERPRLWTAKRGSSIWLCTVCPTVQKMSLVRKHWIHSWTSAIQLAVAVMVLCGPKCSWVHTAQIRIGHIQYVWCSGQWMTSILSSSMQSILKKLASGMTMIWQDCNKSKGRTCVQTLTSWSQTATSLFTEDLHWSSATLTRHAHARGMGQTKLQMPKFSTTWIFELTWQQAYIHIHCCIWQLQLVLSPPHADFHRHFWLCKDVQ